MNKYYQLTQNGNEADIQIYGDITSMPFIEGDMSGSLLSEQIKNLECDAINVYINSYGGEVCEGLAIYNQLKRHKAKVKTICDGFACSIASVIFMAGDERIMSNASLLMIHNAWCTVSGNAKELRKQADDLEKITQASVNAYMEHLNISEEELIKLLDNESWLTPSEAIEMGFATSLVKEEADAVSQSVKQSLVDMIINMKKAEDDEDKKKPCNAAEPDNTDEDKPKSKALRCPVCDYDGEMEQDEDGYYVCPECQAKFKLEDEPDDPDDDMDDDPDDNMDQKCKDDDEDKEKQKNSNKVQHEQRTLLSSFFNAIK